MPLFPRDDGFWQAATPREGRARLVTALRYELLGPETPEEELRESPLTRYATGMLAPFGTGTPDEEHDEEPASGADDEEAGAVELGPPMSQAITPSSIGLSFLIPLEVTKLTVLVAWGDYRLEEVQEKDVQHPESEGEPEGVSDAEVGDHEQRRHRPRHRWVRMPHEPEPLIVELKPNAGLKRIDVRDDNGVTVEHLSRSLGNRLAVSVFLVNRRTRGERARPPVDSWIFQPTLTVRSPFLTAVFMPRELEPALAHSDRDRESNRLLFRARREFAIGHGCAAEWTAANSGERAGEVWTGVASTLDAVVRGVRNLDRQEERSGRRSRV